MQICRTLHFSLQNIDASFAEHCPLFCGTLANGTLICALLSVIWRNFCMFAHANQ